MYQGELDGMSKNKTSEILSHNAEQEKKSRAVRMNDKKKQLNQEDLSVARKSDIDLLPFAEGEHQNQKKIRIFCESAAVVCARGQDESKLKTMRTRIKELYRSLVELIDEDPKCVTDNYEQVLCTHSMIVETAEMFCENLSDPCLGRLEDLRYTAFDARLNVSGQKCVLVLSARMYHRVECDSILREPRIAMEPIESSRTANYDASVSGNIRFGAYSLPFELFGIILDYHGRSVMSLRNLYTVNKDVCHVLGGSSIGNLLCSRTVIWDVPLNTKKLKQYKKACSLVLRNKNIERFSFDENLDFCGVAQMKHCTALRRLRLRTIPQKSSLTCLTHLTHLNISDRIPAKTFKDMPLRRLKFKCVRGDTLRDLPTTITHLSLAGNREFLEIPPLALSCLSLENIGTGDACRMCKPFLLDTFKLSNDTLQLSVLVSTLQNMPLTRLKLKNKDYDSVNVQAICTSSLESLKHLQHLSVIGSRRLIIDSVLPLRYLKASIQEVPALESLPNIRALNLVLEDHAYWNDKSIAPFVDALQVGLSLDDHKVYIDKFAHEGTSRLYELLLMFRRQKLAIYMRYCVPIWPIASVLKCEKLRFNNFSIDARRSNSNQEYCVLF